jgi:hypothetical protein
VTWDVRQGSDGTWGVVLGDTTTIEPLYPSETGVAPAAEQWVDARQRCETPANEFAGLLGPPQLAEELCGVDGDLTIGAPAPLGDVESNAFSTAFGPETAEIARAVRVSGPVELVAVLVPIGDDWTVIGVVP